MKTLNLKNLAMLALLMVLGLGTAMAQRNNIGFFRAPNQDGVNVFEAPKVDTVEFDGVKVRVGGAFAIQFQSLEQTNSEGGLDQLGSDLNLPTANLNLDVALAPGMRLHMSTYLSSRNHAEAWVKGGYLQIDKLDFIKEGFAEGLMDVSRIRVGYNDINYGDAHFRRSDNARAIFNPFVGNYIMDAFTTEPFLEVSVLPEMGFIGVLGVSNGKLNQSNVVDDPDDTGNSATIYGKLGYDKQINDDLRVRLTGSFYSNGGRNTGGYLYTGDRAGARYYDLFGSWRAPRIGPRFREGVTAFQVNPFIKFGGLEFFGIYETVSESEDASGGEFTQLAGELLYRFGDIYVGGRYNTVTGQMDQTFPEVESNRFNIGGGWFLTKNVMTKVEYVKQTWSGDWGANNASELNDASFDGFVIEAVISF